MGPKDYCEWCRTSHADMTCAEHQEAKRQWYIDNPHSCHQCRAWAREA